MDAEMKAAFDELLTAMNAGFNRLGRASDPLEEEPGDRRTDRPRDIRWEVATLKNRVAASKNELAAIQHTLATLENRLKDIERQEVA